MIPGEWRIDAPDPDQLVSALAEPETAAIAAKVRRYKKIGAKWQSMLARRRPGDEVWRFNLERGRTGITLVRNGRPIARFETFGSL
jgi:hypothetical protein